MDDEIKIQLAKLLNPASILPNLRLTRRPETPQNNILPDDTNHASKESRDAEPYASEESDPDYTPEEKATEPPTKKKCTPANSLTLSQNGYNYPVMRSRDLHYRIQGDKVIEFCQEHGLIANEVMCSCGKPMRLVSKSGNDGCRWICYVKSHSARPNQTIRKGTWFDNAKLSLGDILWMAYMWVHEYSIISMMHECDHSNTTLMIWCTCCTEFCRKVVEYKNKPIGGEEKSVEIFYCRINENKRPTGRWAFCGIELYSSNSLHLVVDDKDSFTLLQIFDRYILPGTKVVVNNWSFLKTLNLEDFGYLTEKRTILFVDLTTNEKIDTFEMFKKMLNRPSKLDEWSKVEYGSNFFEKMYRKCLKSAPDAYLAFLKDVAMIYKPCDRYLTNSMES